MTKESSSCIDLVFTSNPRVISAAEVELSSLRSVTIIQFMEKCLMFLFHHRTYMKFEISKMER